MTKHPNDVSLKEFRALGHTSTALLKAVRLNCIDCCSGSKQEVKDCAITNCFMWPFRMGHRPTAYKNISKVTK